MRPKTDARSEMGELRWRRRDVRTATLFEAGHKGLVSWLLEHFGQHSYGKTIPAWALTMPERHKRNLLDGYLSADGHETNRQQLAATVSKKLAIGIRLLAESLGHSVSVNLRKVNHSPDH